MLAYHGKQSVKDEYLKRVQAHHDADEIIKGSYWQDGKGCAVGCTVHSGNHSAYETELAIPRVLARIEDGIFEGLSNEDAKLFPLRFLTAINVGADLTGVADKFLHWLLVDETDGIIKFARSDSSRVAIQAVGALYARKIAGETIDISQWLSVRKDAAAADAAYAAAAADAAYAADADAAAADAAYAADAYAAAAAADAAYAAAAADADAAYARKKARAKQADKLIELLQSAK